MPVNQQTKPPFLPSQWWLCPCVCAVHHYNLANFPPPRLRDSLSDGLFLSSRGDCAAVDERKPHSDGVGYSFTLKQQRERERNKQDFNAPFDKTRSLVLLQRSADAIPPAIHQGLLMLPHRASCHYATIGRAIKSRLPT